QFMLVVVLPSWGSALVTMMTLGGAPKFDSSREVRKARYDSAICDCGLTCVTISTASLEVAITKRLGLGPSRADLEPSGIMPSDARPEIIWACSVVRTVLSKDSRRKASPTPDVRPRTTAKTKFRGTFGSIGPAGGRALSTMRKLLDFKPAATPASLSFSRS